ncbi:GNAT family N-acetyltransferase [Pseudomonas pseudonitroreducens]|uniref:GNAT family N-acetyltransferase n=1 Tax=Pseudomonas pseudonitroreducens TaxID=2892326 RepID=UPI0035A228FC
MCVEWVSESAWNPQISAVCVEDTHRGQGLAGRLMNALRRDIVSRGEIPFLHVFDDNKSALSLYRRLGFEDREDFLLYRLEHCA